MIIKRFLLLATVAFLVACFGVSGEQAKRATFIVLNQNLFEIPAADLSETEVLVTSFNGRVV